MDRVFLYFLNREAILQRDLQEMLSEAEAWSTACYTSEKAFWQAVCTHPPDIILMHISIHHALHHIELIHRIRSRWAIPVLILYSGRPRDLQRYMFRLHAVEILSKPVLLHQITREMHRLLKG